MADDAAVSQYLTTRNVNFFNLLYDRYTDKVYAKCVSMLNNVDSAEDATQEIFIKALLHLSSFNNKSKFSTWLYSITYNYCIDQIRKEKKEIIVAVDDFSNLDLDDDTLFDSEILQVNVDRLNHVLSSIHPDDSSLLLMKYQDDMSIREICEVLGKSESAVKMKILRAKTKFLKFHKEAYGEDPYEISLI